MGRRGPAPMPTAIKKFLGNAGKRPLNANEPQPVIAAKAPEPAAHLDEIAAAEWRRVVPDLHRMGLLSVVDIPALEVYCRAVSTHRRCENWLDEHGLTVVMRDKDGRTKGVIAVPQVGIARGAAKIIKEFGDVFGMTPSARSRLSVAPSDLPMSKLDRWMKATG